MYPELAQLLGLVVFSHGNRGEISRVDASFYPTSRHPTPVLADCSIALEHENKTSTVDQEIRKLALLDVPLRVLVFYSSWDALGGWLSRIQDSAASLEAFSFLAVWAESSSDEPTWHFFTNAEQEMTRVRTQA